MERESLRIKINKIVKTFIFISICLYLSSCLKKVPDKAVVIYSIGNAVIIKPDKKPKTAKIKEVVNSGDTIRTGKDSHLTIQIGTEILVRLQPNTVLNISNLFENNEILIYLQNGQVLSKVKRLRKNSDYKVKSPTALAALRGTEFSVYYSSGESIVAVKKGKVLVEQITKPSIKIVEKGETAVIREEIEVRPITDLESIVIEKVSFIPIIKDVEKQSDIYLEKKGNELLQKEQEIDRRIKTLKDDVKDKFALKTLNDIKQKYGRVDEVTLYNGKVYRGVILSRGNIYKIRTIKGIVDVPSKKIKQTKMIQ